MLDADIRLLLLVFLSIGSVSLALLLFLSTLSDLWDLYFEDLYIKITAGVMLILLTAFYGVKRLLGAKNE